MKDIDEKRSNG